MTLIILRWSTKFCHAFVESDDGVHVLYLKFAFYHFTSSHIPHFFSLSVYNFELALRFVLFELKFMLWGMTVITVKTRYCIANTRKKVLQAKCNNELLIEWIELIIKRNAVARFEWIEPWTIVTKGEFRKHTQCKQQWKIYFIPSNNQFLLFNGNTYTHSKKQIALCAFFSFCHVRWVRMVVWQAK